MLVKKFEARTMKEALEMVKSQLGPEAIILAARDNKKSFGLVGQGSVEITAAVSEPTLQNKKYAETKMVEDDVARFQKISARQQKEIIAKMVKRDLESRPQPAALPSRSPFVAPSHESPAQRSGSKARPLTTRRYIDIGEDILDSSASESMKRISDLEEAAVVPRTAPSPRVSGESDRTIETLMEEVSSLKQALSQFQRMPQQMAPSFPGSDFGLPYDLSFIFERMVKEGLSEKVCGQLLYDCYQKIPPNKIKNKGLVEGWVAKSVLESTRISELDAKAQIHVFFGPAGVGKTSTLVKMASQMMMKEKKRVGLITTDVLKIGAIDQMRIFAQILNVPFAVVREGSDWRKLKDYFEQIDIVLVDFPAVGGRDSEQNQKWLELLPPPNFRTQRHLVLSCTSKIDDMRESAMRWEAYGADDLIVTNLDESVRRGVVFSIMRELNLPLFASGIGPRVPDDFEYATKERVLDLIFKITEQQNQDLLRSQLGKG